MGSVVGVKRGHGARGPEGRRRARPPPASAIEEAFDHELADEADAAAAHGKADGEFAAPGDGADEEKIGDVGAGEHEEHGGEGEQGGQPVPER